MPEESGIDEAVTDPATASDDAVIDLGGRSRWFVLGVVLFGLFSVNVTITILAVSIPRIAGDFGTTDQVMTWVVTGPTLAFGIIGPLVGKLGDRLGHRRVYLWGLFGAAVMAAVSAVAWSAGALITFRTLGAIEGAATGPASFAIISRVFPREQRVKALGFWSMIGAGAPVLGVVIGGPLVEAVGWRALFGCQIPLVLIAGVVAWRVLPETPRANSGTFDVAGAILMALIVSPLLFALSEANQLGWGSPVIVACLALSPVALVGFVVVERRVADPVLPLRYFRRRNFTAPIIALAFLNAAYMGSFILTPLLLENVLGYSESRTGLLSISRPLAFSIVGPIAGYLTVRIGERIAALVGAATVVAGMIWMSTLGLTSTDLMIIGSLAVAGIGMGLSMPALASSITTAVDEHDLGIAGAAQQMMVQVGVVFGIQVMQTVQVARVGPAGLAGSYHQAYLAGGVLAVAGLVASVFIRRIDRHRRPSQSRITAEMALEGGLDALAPTGAT